MKTPLALAALASCFTAASHAASPPGVPENLQACSKLQDAGERVRCYDAQIAAMNASAAPSTKPEVSSRAATSTGGTTSHNAPASTAAASEQSSTTKFGEEFLPATPRTAPHQEEALLSSITGMNEVSPRTFEISLSNGQVWRQQEPSHITLFFHVGDDVRIERGALGSYHMSTAATGSKNWVRVTRVQ